MTEAEWLVCEDPTSMLKALRDQAGDRKLRLFAAACCRSTLRLVGTLNSRTPEEELWQDIQKAERLAEDSHPDHYAYHSLDYVRGNSLEMACDWVMDPSAWMAATRVVRELDDAVWADGVGNCGLVHLRDIFGNPFRPVSFSPLRGVPKPPLRSLSRCTTRVRLRRDADSGRCAARRRMRQRRHPQPLPG